MKTSPPQKFPLGKSDFKNVIEGDYYFVDKSMLIHQIINDNSEILLFTRPRRFGKTLNISMLRYFFEKRKTFIQFLLKALKKPLMVSLMKLRNYPKNIFMLMHCIQNIKDLLIFDFFI
jgi:hypothetical protein